MRTPPLATACEIVHPSALDNWESVAREHLGDLQVGLETLNAAPQTEEERRETFQAKRKTVQALIEKVLIGKDRKLAVFRLDVLSLIEQLEQVSQNKQGETCTRKQ